MKLQTTLACAVTASGIGLHTGMPVELKLYPAPADTGYVFRRADLNGFEIAASPHHVAHVSYATTLMRKGVMVATVEHLLSALHGCGIDNAIIEVNSFEVPILDGSAQPFVEMIYRAGVVSLSAARQTLRILKSVEITEGKRRISIHPSDGFFIDSTIDFDHPLIGRQVCSLEITPESYCREIAPARTFGFLHEAEALRKNGLVRGASLENAVVLDRQGLVNDEPLRFPDEFARHKVLDIVGDLALLGIAIEGRIVAERSGHGLHSALMTKVLREADAWEITEPELAVSGMASVSQVAIGMAYV
ncbi:MAG: UDP-3-O-acyl-N-acetylglucosamine deacetylase [Blastocatellia bacterium]|nr:UDP-3-O-acyl-N-acetylglucosamine deacetylase [Blastocatellia bacterium]